MDIDNLFGLAEQPTPEQQALAEELAALNIPEEELEAFLQQLAETPASVAEEELEQLFSAEEIRAAMQEDLQVLGSVLAPDVVTASFPPLYRWLFSRIVLALGMERAFPKLALGLPRGHAKTFFIKLLLCYIVLFTKKRYILVIAATLPKGVAIISDVMDMLTGYNSVKIFGDIQATQERDVQNLKIFHFNDRAVILEAAGQGTAVRGSNQKNARPDVILLDDAQTAAGAKSIQESLGFHEWFTGTVLKAKNPAGCLFLYLGNMYKDLEIEEGSGIYTCMLRNLCADPSWLSIVFGAILADGTALWEELQPLDQLLSEYASDCRLGQGDTFCAEVLNDPRGMPPTKFDPGKVIAFQKTPDMIHQGSMIVVDPATSKLTPDQMAIGYFEIFDGKPCYMRTASGKYTGPKSAEVIIELALETKANFIAIEDVAYQHTLIEWLSLGLQQLGVTGVEVVPVPSQRSNKNSRILNTLAGLQRYEATTDLEEREAEILLSEDVRATVVNQAIKFDHRITNNIDDELDMLGMAHLCAVRLRHMFTLEHFNPMDRTIQGDSWNIQHTRMAGASADASLPCG